jgi:hypothetical protein
VRTALNAWTVTPDSGQTSSGLTLISATTIGTTVSSVNVTGAFSTTYVNYRILVSDGGVASASSEIGLKLGATATGYYWSRNGLYWSGAAANNSAANATSFGEVTRGTTTGFSCDIDLQNPFLAKETAIRFSNLRIATDGSISPGGGYLANTTSYTDFTLTPASGTLTGGVIYVYGYKK